MAVLNDVRCTCCTYLTDRPVEASQIVDIMTKRALYHRGRSYWQPEECIQGGIRSKCTILPMVVGQDVEGGLAHAARACHASACGGGIGIYVQVGATVGCTRHRCHPSQASPIGGGRLNIPRSKDPHASNSPYRATPVAWLPNLGSRSQATNMLFYPAALSLLHPSPRRSPTKPAYVSLTEADSSPLHVGRAVFRIPRSPL